MAEGRMIKNPAVVCTEMDDGGVLLDLETTAYYSLNRTALRIWNLIDDSASIDEIATRMSTEFVVDYDHALTSAKHLVATLEQERLLRVESA
jgi:Coenzyme PQQ synthesis protein D (PqqD)